jgi:uncharacterized membrane protein
MRIPYKTIMAVILPTLGILYPVLIYFGVRVMSLRTLSLLLAIAFLFVLLPQLKQRRQNHLLLPTALGILLCLIGAFLDHPKFMLYLPVLFAASFFIAFGYTLRHPPSMIEIFASLIVAQLSREEVEYCRRVTIVWVAFFLLNGILAAFTACCASLALWSLYNGLIVYIAMGVLFTAELCFRYWRFRQYVGLRTDFIFKKIFPPRE